MGLDKVAGNGTGMGIYEQELRVALAPQNSYNELQAPGSETVPVKHGMLVQKTLTAGDASGE